MAILKSVKRGNDGKELWINPDRIYLIEASSEGETVIRFEKDSFIVVQGDPQYLAPLLSS